MLSYLRSMKLTDFSMDAMCRIGKTKTNEMVFITEGLALIKVLRREKGYDN